MTHSTRAHSIRIAVLFLIATSCDGWAQAPAAKSKPAKALRPAPLSAKAASSVVAPATTKPAVKTAASKPQAPPMTEAQKIATVNIREYLRRLTVKQQEKALSRIKTRIDWEHDRPRLQQQIREMLGLDPMPERGDLKATVTGRIERPGLVIEKLHFQSAPGLYVTANFYRPEKIDKPLPTILYLCGHGKVKIDGVSYGNKTHYQHHGLWFARNGYCCLIVDTLQLGEIEGEHAGTHRLGMWWWICRGYTPAGVEAWNAIRALDYLETRPEVDKTRFGVTGRSGGGIYSWWLAALDDRPKCIAPVAGITDLENYVVDDCIEGHCDCMFLANFYGWDYPTVAALAAPRPVLFCNSDKDRIFPLTGVVRTHAKLKNLYRLLGSDDKLGLVITEGPHNDTQELQVPVFRWMNRWLRNVAEPVTPISDTPIPPQELRVFQTLPDDHINTTVQNTFVKTANAPTAPKDMAEWTGVRDHAIKSLKETVFHGWPDAAPDLKLKQTGTHTSNGVVLDAYEFTSEENLRLPLYIMRGEAHPQPKILVINVVDQAGWKDWLGVCDRAFADLEPEIATVPHRAQDADLQRKLLTKNAWAFATIAPRGIGPTQWNPYPPANTQILRRFYLLGRTADDGRIWDVRRAIQSLESLPAFKSSRFWLQGDGVAAGIALYAGIFEERVERLDLHRLPTSHRDGPILLGIMKQLDVPFAVALPFPRKVVLYDVPDHKFDWSKQVANVVGPAKPPLEFRKMPAAKPAK